MQESPTQVWDGWMGIFGKDKNGFATPFSIHIPTYFDGDRPQTTILSVRDRKMLALISQCPESGNITWKSIGKTRPEYEFYTTTTAPNGDILGRYNTISPFAHGYFQISVRPEKS